MIATSVVLALAASACSNDARGPGFANVAESSTASFAYMIPPGAGAALDRGEPLEILPGTLEATVGQTIEIVNQDDRGHNVGPWFVGAGETVSQEFTSPGTFEGVCTVHPSGELVLVVSP